MLDRTSQPVLDPLPQAAGQRAIRVCQVVATSEGGTWHLEQLTTLKAQYGYDTVSLLPDRPGGLAERLNKAGIPCLAANFDFPSLPPFSDLIKRTCHLAGLFRRERFDVVHTSLWHSMLLGRLAGWLADVPVRVHMAAGIFHQEAPISRWIDRDTCFMETALIGGCHYLGDLYRGFGVDGERCKVVYFGPDESRFRPDLTPTHDLRAELSWPATTPVIVHVAWFYARVPANRWAPDSVAGDAVKGHEDLIRAAPHILAKHPDAKIVFVGSGWLEGGSEYMRQMQTLVREIGLEDSVIFLGARSDVNEILKGVDVAVQPSRNECCGGTLEALLMECPTVATRVGGMPEMVIDGKTGVVVEPADPKDLARGICFLLEHKDRARAFGRAGRANVLALATLSRSVADLDRIYREFLFRDGRRQHGYRLWVTALRFPVLIVVAAYLHWRLTRVEYHYLPKWQAGWRPWHLDALRAMPKDFWNQPGLTLLRHRVYCAAVSARGHTVGMRQRAICRGYVVAGTLKSCRQRAICRAYVVAGTLKSYRQRAVCRAYVIAGTLQSYRQRAVCRSYRVLGHGRSLYQRSVCAAYRLAGRLKNRR